MREIAKIAALGSALVVLCATASAGSKISHDLPAFASAWKLSVGSGAEYEYRFNGRNAGPTDVAIVGRESIHGRPGFWVEFSAPGPLAKQLARKSLFFIDGKRIIFTRTVLDEPGYGPMELPGGLMALWSGEELRMMAGSLYVRPVRSPQESEATHYPYGLMLAHGWDGVPRAKHLGFDTITTPAGTFLCQHWRFGRGRGDVWISKGAGPFALVRAEIAEKGTRARRALILRRVIADAKDRITGALRPYEPGKLIPSFLRAQVCAQLQRSGLQCSPHL